MKGWICWKFSGGTYEQPKLVGLDSLTLNPDRAEEVKKSTVAREAYFLEYAKDIRAVFKNPMMVTGGFRSRAGMDAALEAGACDMIGLGRPLCVDSDIVNKLVSKEVDTTTIFEKSLQMGPSWLHWLIGLNSPIRLFSALNGWGQQGWWCTQIINMGEGRDPDLELGVFKAFTGYQASEKKPLPPITPTITATSHKRRRFGGRAKILSADLLPAFRAFMAGQPCGREEQFRLEL